jgi:hypothetical protein
MKKTAKWGFLLGAIMAFSLTLSPRGWADDVKYIYYPPSQVYFNPASTHYFYMDNGVWVDRTVAPVGINLGKGVSVNLGGPIPYTYHPEVIRQYPTTYIIKD